MIVSTYFVDDVKVLLNKNKVHEYLNEQLRKFQYKSIQDDSELIEFENTLKKLVANANNINHRVKPLSYNKCGFILGGHLYYFTAGEVQISSIRIITIRGNWKEACDE